MVWQSRHESRTSWTAAAIASESPERAAVTRCADTVWMSETLFMKSSRFPDYGKSACVLSRPFGKGVGQRLSHPLECDGVVLDVAGGRCPREHRPNGADMEAEGLHDRFTVLGFWSRFLGCAGGWSGDTDQRGDGEGAK